MKQYHYLIAGLPDLLFDNSKAPFSSKQLFEELCGHLKGEDLDIIKLFFWRYDTENVVARLKSAESSVNPMGNLSSEELDELFNLIKNGSVEKLPFEAPGFIGQLIEAYKADKPLIEGKSWEIQASELYYQHVCQIKNEFISKWFCFERDLLNFITATKCRNNNISIDNQLVGKSELTEKLKRSGSKDFGIHDELPYLDLLLKALNVDDLLEQERKIDAIKWQYLDDQVFFFYFSIEKIFAFLLKLAIIERWMNLDEKTGRELFKTLLKQMETSYKLPDEFSSN